MYQYPTLRQGAKCANTPKLYTTHEDCSFSQKYITWQSSTKSKGNRSQHLSSDFCRKISFSLADNSKQMKAEHPTNSRSKVPSNEHCKWIIKIFQWYIFSYSGLDENNSNESLQINKRDECKNVLNYMDYGNKRKWISFRSFKYKFCLQ